MLNEFCVLRHFAVNKFKTLDKTNKIINTILCRLHFYFYFTFIFIFHGQPWPNG